MTDTTQSNQASDTVFNALDWMAHPQKFPPLKRRKGFGFTWEQIQEMARDPEIEIEDDMYEDLIEEYGGPDEEDDELTEEDDEYED